MRFSLSLLVIVVAVVVYVVEFEAAAWGDTPNSSSGVNNNNNINYRSTSATSTANCRRAGGNVSISSCLTSPLSPPSLPLSLSLFHSLNLSVCQLLWTLDCVCVCGLQLTEIEPAIWHVLGTRICSTYTQHTKYHTPHKNTQTHNTHITHAHSHPDGSLIALSALVFNEIALPADLKALSI